MPNKTEQQLDDIAQKTQKNLEYAQQILGTIPDDSEKKLNEIKKLLDNNLEFSKIIYKGIVKIHHYIFWQRIWGVLKIIIIIIPLIIGAIYLPPLFREIFDKWQEAFMNLGPQ